MIIDQDLNIYLCIMYKYLLNLNFINDSSDKMKIAIKPFFVSVTSSSRTYVKIALNQYDCILNIFFSIFMQKKMKRNLNSFAFDEN